jgi:hypothetical protein
MAATVLFGGSTYSTVLGDTWMFSHATGWMQLSPPVSPPALGGAAMAYDPTTKKVVLFGGFLTPEGGTTVINSDETWTWDGATWTQQFPPVSPPAAGYNTDPMVFDIAIGKVVLFGGAGLNCDATAAISAPFAERASGACGLFSVEVAESSVRILVLGFCGSSSRNRRRNSSNAILRSSMGATPASNS